MIERKKTSYTISKVLSMELDDMRKVLGVGKSDFVSMSIAFMLMNLAPLKRTPLKRRMVLRRVAEEFQNLHEEALQKLEYRG